MSTSDGGRYFLLRNVVWLLLIVAGGALWAHALRSDSARAWRSLLINFTFFTSLAGGLVVWPAVVRSCNGKWHERLERCALGGVSFAAPSLLALIALWAGAPGWSPWHGEQLHQGLWLKDASVLGRDLACLILFWALAGAYFLQRRKGEARRTGVVLVLVYCLVFSLLGFDLVMALDPEWHSSLAGGYFFMSGLYIAITGWAFLAVWQTEARKEQLLDLGRLMVAFSLMTTYLMYSNLLPIWYENLPHEVRFAVPRINFQPWLSVSYALLGVVYFGPLVLLLPERSKKNRWYLGGVSLLVLIGMWVERWWLVTPTFEGAIRFGLAELSLTAAFAGLLAVGMELFNRMAPSAYPTGEEQK